MNGSSKKLPSIFTPKDSFAARPDEPPALLRGGASALKIGAAATTTTTTGAASSFSLSSRRKSTPDWLERAGGVVPVTAAAAAAAAAEAGSVVTAGSGYTGGVQVGGVGKRGAGGDSASWNNTNTSAWAAGAASDRTVYNDFRGRSASVSQVATAVRTPPGEFPPPPPPPPPLLPAVTKTPGWAEALKRKRDRTPIVPARQAPTSEPALKRPRFAKTKHTLDGFNFGPIFNEPALQPPSPLFFSNSPRPRPTLPPRFSSSEAAAKMLSKARTEDSHVKTVSLPRGSIVATPGFPSAGGPRSGSELSAQRSLDRGSVSGGGRSSSPDLSGSPGEIGLLNSIGVIELLEQDERPTFIVDLAESGNYGPGQLHPVYANSSLRSYMGMLELVNGTASDDASPGPKTYLQFKSWLLSASIDGESLNVCLPSFVYAGMTWSCSTLRKRLRIISGAVIAGTPAPTGQMRASVPRTMIAEPPSESMNTGERALEPADYFAGALPPPAVTKDPARETPAGRTEIVPTIEDTAAHANGTLPPHQYTDLSGATNLLPSSHMYVHDFPERGRKDFAGGGGVGDLLRGTPTSSTVDSLHSHIELAPSDAPCFDWTRLPVSDSMPPHIQFARSVDWAATALGPIELWSSDLRQMCNLIMASPHPAAMYWGDDLIAIYNEAYILLAGQKHPMLMGQSYREAWVEIWDEVKDVFASARVTGEATMKDDDCLFMKRNDFLEETYFSWSIIPMVGRDGSVMGLYNPAFEKTRRKIAERRMLTLREVGERTASARDVKGFWEAVLGSFDFNTHDSPFLLLYSVAEEYDSDASSMHSNSVLGSRQCLLEGALGVPEGHVAAPEQVDLKAGMEGFGPVFREVMKTDKPVLLEVGGKELPERLLQGLEFRGFGDPVRAVVICPIHPTTGDGGSILGFLVLGVNPRRPYDDDYSLFVQLLSRQLATSLASVVLFEEEIRRGQKAARLAALDRIELSEQLAARTQEAIESETKFTRMAEFAPVGMFIADHSGRITFANDTWYDISRVPRSATNDVESGRDTWMEAIKPEDRELVRGLWTDLVVGTKAVSSEFRFKTQWHNRNGAPGDTWVLFSAYPEKYDDGRLKSVFGSITNISQQKWAEGIQTRKMEEAVELKRQQMNFIDITSHEMRNPLSAILQCSDEIANSLTTFQQSGQRVIPDELLSSCLDAAQIINLCSQHQKRIVDDILTLSKLDSQLLLVTPVDAQPLTVVQRALKMHEGELQAADIQMKFVVDPSYRDLDLDWVRLDPSRVLQVLINLTTNAIKFTGTESRRTITVTVAASRERPSALQRAPVEYFPTRRKSMARINEADWGEGEVVYIHFSVKDTGRGLNPEEKKVLFMRFSQASPRTHVQYGGSGLGLFISRELTELQGGEVGVASESGKGSTFAFYVAARRSVVPVETEGGTGTKFDYKRGRSLPSTGTNVSSQKKLEGPPHPSPGSQPTETKPSQQKVLIVEDNLVNQRVLQKQLKNLGTEVHLANHGGEALEKLRQSTYWAEGGPAGKLEVGVVLMDQEMPVMDGLTCTRKIRELEAEGKLTGHVPIIGVTANARAEQIQTALLAGMDDVVSKPFRIPELVPKIEELLERYPMPSASPAAAANEKERLDAMHQAWYVVALENRLHLATLRRGRLRILDLGYGTGIWAVEMKRLYPEAEVIAIDIGNDHPTADEDDRPVDFGVDFRSGVDFTQDDWGLKEGSFDFVHAAMLCGSVGNWQDFISKVTRLLKPVSGQAEFLEIDWTPRSDSDSPNSTPTTATTPTTTSPEVVPLWWHSLRAASAATHKPLAYPTDIASLIQRAGCTVLNHRLIDVHTAAELVDLAADDPATHTTRWFRYAMFAPVFQTVHGMSMALLTRQLGWTAEEVAGFPSSRLPGAPGGSIGNASRVAEMRDPEGMLASALALELGWESLWRWMRMGQWAWQATARQATLTAPDTALLSTWDLKARALDSVDFALHFF
ncbi:hypothetical protein B0A55_02743 [Friedmanniomyces simplex]|uniref:Hybrid signal transduction histidine kinase K n=1 Tax=Friedmanniomyces simplex TaxID=329884 RepID=A0A4U0XVK0_9PEZI|nr:hypothetical protein B0A55_02743 [Friedmanniomyces simplex]